MKRKNIKDNGFSLIEMMIILAIMGILAVISMGYLDSSRKRTICAEVETAAHETLLEAVKFASQYNQQPPANATALGVNLPAHVANIQIGGTGTTANPITVNGTAVNNDCPLGQTYILIEGNTKGNWQ
jgi:prepilin-type N-terminal cleavage/methylation domain-containing protein